MSLISSSIMSYRVSRQPTSTTFKIKDQLCRVSLTPWYEYKDGFWIWNVSFAVGNSRRQLRDWYNHRKNKRVRKIKGRIVGKSGVSAIAKGFENVLRIRWNVRPGDLIVIDCTSGKPEQQFKAFKHWHRHHSEWLIHELSMKFYWYRPPYPTDQCWQYNIDVIPVTPKDPLQHTQGDNYFACFFLQPRQKGIPQSTGQRLDQLNQDQYNQ
jgi:hypothetical protein